jgi:hypothetical protein
MRGPNFALRVNGRIPHGFSIQVFRLRSVELRLNKQVSAYFVPGFSLLASGRFQRISYQQPVTRSQQPVIFNTQPFPCFVAAEPLYSKVDGIHSMPLKWIAD